MYLPDLTPCKNCGGEIHFMKTRRYDHARKRFIVGKAMPLEPGLVHGNGKRTIVVVYPETARGTVIPKAGPEYQGYEPHFGFCKVSRQIKLEL